MNRKKKTRLVIIILASVSSLADLFIFSLLCEYRIKELINEPPFWIREKCEF